jgi:preprotein translocase subunit SecE
VKDKKDMSTAVTATGSNDAERSKPSGKPAGEPSHSPFQVYKPGEGYVTRLGMLAVLMAFVGFACHHWYYNWVSIRNFLEPMCAAVKLGFLTDWTYGSAATQALASGGAALMAVAGFLTSYYYIYLKRSTADFLIKTDLELSKVTWPKISPWFKPETQVWGATYVVLIVIAALTLYIAGVDLVLRVLTDYLFYKRQ